jgi:hypothetical protein
MSIQLFSNNASTTLAGNITSGSLSLSVLTGSGALFPVIAGGSGNYFIGTLNKAGAPATLEIVKVTATATDTFTIARAQEGTSPLAWNAGDIFSLLCTAGTLGDFIQPPQLQAQSGNFAIDTGAANAYVVGLTPALTAHVEGLPILWQAGHANTGASTFNDGAGPASLIVEANVGISAVLAPNNVVVGGFYISVWDGLHFVLLNPSLFMQNAQFPGVLVGVSGGGGITFIYSRVLDQVMLFNSTTLLAPSTSTGLVLTGLPAVITPATTKVIPAGMTYFTDNSAALGVPVDALISSAGSITFLKNGNAAGWTNGGNKGIVGSVCLSYSIQ